MFTLAISCLNTTNLPWFMDLTFQVAMQHYSLQHRILLSPSDTSTTGHCFCFDSDSSFFLELFICSSLIVYETPIDLGWGLSFSVISFAFSYCSWGSQGKNAEVVFSSKVDYVFSKLPIMTRPSWVALHSMAHGFIELHKAVIHVIILVSFLF